MASVPVLAAIAIIGLLWRGGPSFSAIVAGTTLSGTILMRFVG